MPHTISVFLSSTGGDLDEYRKAVYQAIQGLDGYRCVRMEDFGARDWQADEFCRGEVAKCDLFVGILGHFYGSCPPQKRRSFTEREYDAAVKAGKPRLMFLAPDDFPLPAGLIQEDDKRFRNRAFRKRVSKESMRDSFTTPEDLAGRVRQALHNWKQSQDAQRWQKLYEEAEQQRQIAQARQQDAQRAEEELRALNDTLEKRVAERSAVAEQRARELAAVLDNIGDGLIVADAHGEVLLVNPAARRMLGEKVTDLKDKWFVEQLRAGQTTEVCIGRGGDSARVAEQRVVETEWDGRPAYLISLHDITERKQAAEMMHFLASASKVLAGSLDYHATLGSVARLAVPHLADWCSVHMVEEDGSIHPMAVVHADPTKEEKLRDMENRYLPDPESSEGIPLVLRTRQADIQNSLSPESLAGLAQSEEHLQLLRELGLASRLIVPLVARRTFFGTMTLAAKAARRYTPADLTLAEDLARRAAAAIDNARLYRAAWEADQQKDAFIAMLAHELRDTLAPIRNSIPVLDPTDPDASSRSREVLERNVRHLVHLIDNLLDLSRLSRGKIQLHRERLDLTGLVLDTIDKHLHSLQQANIRIKRDLPPAQVWVSGDPSRLAQVLSILLDTATRSTNLGGDITVRVTTKDGEQAAVCVRHTGRGIEPELVSWVFKPFRELDPSPDKTQEGLGLSLALVRGLVELHGGEVRAASAGLKQGAEYTVFLPSKETRDLQELLTEKPQAGKKRILVIEDNRTAAKGLQDYLTMLGHQVAIAHSGPEGVEAARLFRPDLVLCDIQLPGMNGYEVAEELRRDPATAKTLLVAMSGYGQEEDRRRSVEAGFLTHVTKPIEPEELLWLLRDLSLGEHRG